ncbi:MAG: hypothetical protein DMF73_19025 [Acidobacteria bacterium]|nr:MAG: hypothetical protein DMF73_19025 [Acidobacteriota bacterium]
MSARKNIALPLALAWLLLPCPSALAQSQTTGRVAGTVRDSNGAVIAGAEVKIVSEETGAQREAKTNEDGSYSVPSVPPGRYRVSISSSGFSLRTEITDVAITETVTLNFTLTVAGPGDNSVEIAAPLTQTDGPQLGRVVDSHAVSELPHGRGPKLTEHLCQRRAHYSERLPD